MIRTLRAFFLGRLLREKLLLVGFAAIAVLIWLSGFSSRAAAFWRVQRATTADLKVQDEWLRNEDKIRASANQAASQFDPSRTLDGNRLFVKVRQLAADAGLRNTTNQGSEPDVTNGQFSVHTVRFQITNADWESIKKFYLLLNQNAPYIAIDQFILQPSPNPAQLTLTLRVKSFEIPRT
jgi:hypothetical protein